VFTSDKFEELYSKYNKRKYVSPDPLQFLYDYDDLECRTIVALIASGLAYGRVKQILKSTSVILKELQPDPATFLLNSNLEELNVIFEDFKHRFTNGSEMALFLFSIKEVIKQYGSLKAAFFAGYSKSDEDILPALKKFAEKITVLFPEGKSYLFPNPANGSASKRPILFLRWMIRSDEVDPGGWNEIPSSKLIIPLDTHMYQFAVKSGFTKRKSADIKTAVEITECFKKINPDDPVKYDFALTRFGIRDDLSPSEI